jgi:hypothetical protein
MSIDHRVGFIITITYLLFLENINLMKLYS